MNGAAIGSAGWNDAMYLRHRTPYEGLAGVVERARLRRIMTWARSEWASCVLDVGCGEGVLLDAFDPSTRVVGIDLSRESLRACRRIHPHRAIAQADGTYGLPFASGTFDLVICSEVLEHVPDPAGLLSELRRVCAAEGRVILTVPIERPKLAVKAILRRTPLFDRLLPGIERGFSAWHLRDFAYGTLKSLLLPRFRIMAHRRVLGLHRCMLLRPRSLTA